MRWRPVAATPLASFRGSVADVSGLNLRGFAGAVQLVGEQDPRLLHILSGREMCAKVRQKTVSAARIFMGTDVV